MTSTTTARPITRVELADHGATDEYMTELDLAVHEAGHALAATLLGGRVHTAVVTASGGVTGLRGFTKFAPLGPDKNAAVGFAGPWVQARWQVGRRPTMRQVNAAMDGTSHEDRKLVAAVGGLSLIGPEIPMLLERCWPSVLSLAGKLRRTGEVSHDDVLAALNLTERTAPMGLANIRSGAAPGSFRLT